MAQPYVGEIRMFGGNFAPVGWLTCDGQLLPISENETLFQLIGTTYGGDGESTFALPDLRGRIPIHNGQGPGLSSRQLGEDGGSEAVTLTVNQIPAHGHPLLGSTDNGLQPNPGGSVLASSTVLQPYTPTEALDTAMSSSSITSVGGSQPHDNVQPFLCVTFIISLFGIFPSQS